MQRQSLGSPSSKLHTQAILKEDNHLITQDQKDHLPSPLAAAAAAAADGEERKSQKPHRKSFPKPEKLVHLIPILTVLCFLVLYLSSHDPAQKDLPQVEEFKRQSKTIDSTEIDDIGRFLEIEKGDVLAIRSMRNLQEVNRHRRLHRKIADF
ncbi:hypothetical protein RJ640_017798 [Escallonia rubra]|uniref:Uncharacterized protein n=1 Tax=Escallonia rubra TaxID=112253 RepID=A0AA88UVX8_9ASTE|nr:hypothetical protein RJ640_017798 [Escallonia rubra]